MRAADTTSRAGLLTFLSVAVTVGLTGAVLGLVSCEGDSDSSPISISPSSASLYTGNAMDFTASGGSDYSWSLKYEDTGTLSTHSGPQTRFTSMYGGAALGLDQVLTVTGIAPDGQPASAEVHISQLSTAGGGDDDGGIITNVVVTNVYTNNVIVTNVVVTNIIVTNIIVTNGGTSAPVIYM